MTTEQIDQMFEEMQQYQKSNFGLKNGPDFPAIAKMLLTSQKFKAISAMATALGMITVLSLPRGEEMKNKDTEKFLEDSPLREVLADVFFAGFKIGCQQREISELVKMESGQ